MKKIILSLFIALLGSLCYGQGGLEGVIVEEVDASVAGPGLTAYRVFVDLEPGYELQQVRGNAAFPLTISTTTAWFNNATFGAVTGDNINSALIPVFPDVEFDSYVSLGAASSTEWGVLTSDDPSGRMVLGPVNMVSTLGTIDLAGNFGAAATSNTLMVDMDGQFFTLTSNADVAPGNRIYIGQFTTDGEFSFSINIQTRVAGTNNFTVLNAVDVPALNYPVEEEVLGCTDETACNFNPEATLHDDSCIFCDDFDACTEDLCVEGECMYVAIDCDDGNACTVDACNPVEGCVYTDVDCDDGDACTMDACDPSDGCIYTDVDCDDGNACTIDVCDPSDGCIYTDVDCDDGNACTMDACDPSDGCIYTDIDCDDGDACTIDSCDPAVGCVYTAVDCNDDDPNTLDSCDPVLGCINTPIECDDGDACTIDSQDDAGGCVYTPLDCDDGDACTMDSCDPEIGCVYTDVDCDDNDPTTADSCDPLIGCVNTPIECDDGDACTIDTQDDAGGCVYTPVDCDDGNACTMDSCDPEIGCVYTDVDCDDGDACTMDTCDPSDGCIYTAIDCDDGDPCTTDTCDPEIGCVFTDSGDSDGDGTCDNLDVCPNGPEPGATCDDGNEETINDVVGTDCICSGTVISDTPVNNEADGALPNTPGRIWGVPGWDTFQVGNATLSAQACADGNPTSDSWYSFVAQSENQGILARANPSDPNAANVDMAVEVFDATLTPLAGTTGGACTESRSCFNNVGAGEIERCVPGGLTIGDTYYYRVYDAAGGATGPSLLVDTKVKIYAPHPIVEGCNEEGISIADMWTIEDPTNLYNIPPVPVFNVRMVITDMDGNVVAMTEPKNPAVAGGLNFSLGEFSPALPDGDYSLHAQNEVKMHANGCISSYWSQLGPGCHLELGIPENQNPIALNGVSENWSFIAFPNPNEGDQVFINMDKMANVNQMVIVEVFDMFGKKVHFEQFASASNEVNKILTFDQHLSTGLYLINLTIDDFIITKKLIVE